MEGWIGVPHVGVTCGVLDLVVPSFYSPGALGLSKRAPVARQVNHLQSIAGPHAAQHSVDVILHSLLGEVQV
jgi:hypothetical protein